MAEEPRYTLTEAKRELAVLRCAADGHRPDLAVKAGQSSIAVYWQCDCGLLVWVSRESIQSDTGTYWRESDA